MTATADRGNGAPAAATLDQRNLAIPADLGTDNGAAEIAAAALLTALGIALDNDDLRATPARLARALREMLTPPRFDPTCFDNAEGYDELVVVEAIPFF